MPLPLELHGRGIDAGQLDRLTGFGFLAAEADFVQALPSAVDEMLNHGRE